MFLRPGRYRQSSIRRLLVLLFLSSLTFCLCLGQSSSRMVQAGWGRAAIAQSHNANQLVQQGVQQYQTGNFQAAINNWQTALDIYQDTNERANQAIVLENLARAYQEVGQINQAISYWKQAIADHRQLGDLQQAGRALTEQAQAYSRLGQHRQAIALLCGASNKGCTPDSAVQIAQVQSDQLGEAAALGSLGEADRLRGNNENAIKSLQASLKIAQKIDHPQLQTSALNSLGNAYSTLAQVNYRLANSAQQIGESQQADQLKQAALNQDAQALDYFQESLKLAQVQNNQLGQMRSRLNAIPLHYRRQANLEADQNLQEALALLENLPQTREKVYAAIDCSTNPICGRTK